MYKTYCGIEYENPRQYSGHITSCIICKNKIKEEKKNWNVKCKCGCEKITKYKKKFYSRNCYYQWKSNDSDLKNRISKSVKKLYEDPDYREFISRRTKEGMSRWIADNKDKFEYKKYERKTNSDVELFELKSKNSKNRWKDETFREKVSNSLKKASLLNNESRKKSLIKMWNDRSDEERESIATKISQTKSKLIASGELVISHGNKKYKKGYYGDEWYDSSYELKRMKQLDGMGVSWTKKHNIIIKYIDVDGKKRNYIPDFFIDDKIIEEIKGYITKTDIQKSKYAKKFCKDNNMTYVFLCGKNLIQNKELSSD